MLGVSKKERNARFARSRLVIIVRAPPPFFKGGGAGNFFALKQKGEMEKIKREGLNTKGGTS